MNPFTESLLIVNGTRIDTKSFQERCARTGGGKEIIA